MDLHPGKPHITALTGLRFFAALAVLLTHYNGRSVPSLARTYLDHGNTAVSFFFVLSGFILTYTYGESFCAGRGDHLSFWQARFARIYPLHLFTLITCTIVLLSSGGLSDHSSSDLVISWLANLFLVHVWIPGPIEWNAPSWSIAHEALFYAAFPFVVVLLNSVATSVKRLLLLILTIWIGQVVVFSAGYSLFSDYKYNEDILAYGPVFRCWEFILGVLIGLVLLKLQTVRPSGFLQGLREAEMLRNRILALVLFTIAIIPLVDYFRQRFSSSSHGEWSHNVFLYPYYTPLFVVAIFLVAQGRSFLSPVIENRFIVYLGEASYSLYMIHWTFLLVIYSYAPSGSLLRLVCLAFATPLIILASIFTYRWIELPLRNRLRAKSSRRELGASLARNTAPPGTGFELETPSTGIEGQ